MILPGVAVLITNNYLPMLGMVLAFKNYIPNHFWESKWVGFKNFQFLFKSNEAWVITRNTLLYNLAFILISITIAVVLAIIFAELTNRKTAKFYQSVMFLPYFLSWVVVSYLVFALLSSDLGYINSLIVHFGGKRIEWYNQPKYWPTILITVNTWKWTGYDSVIYLASIIGFDKSYYEAAVVDGATRFQQIIKITIPLLIPIIVILTLMKIGRIFYCDFGLFFNVTKNTGALYDATDVIDTYVYKALIQTGNTGMASAAGCYQSFVGFIVVLTANLITRKVSPENALF
ncbi:MAG: ABC transporter permease subunit [Bacillota bacterium]|nr:ABC transporter permease subunit [Bacillota bacterium]